MLRMRYRDEWKFLLEPEQRTLLYERLRRVLDQDEHCGPDGSYTVHSLYFDDLTDSCARENEAGSKPRTKYRIRCYGNGKTGMFLERKDKVYGKCRKVSCPLSPAEHETLIGGEAAELFWQTEEPLLRQFCLLIMERGFSPKLVLDYERAALIEPAANIRVTFDTAVSAADCGHGFPMEEGTPRFPLLAAEGCILEVKFDDILPGWLREMIESPALQQVPFSKYYLGRKTLEEVYR